MGRHLVKKLIAALLLKPAPPAPGQVFTPLWGLLQFLESSSCTSEMAHTSGKRPGLGQSAEMITMQQAGGEQESL